MPLHDVSCVSISLVVIWTAAMFQKLMFVAVVPVSLRPSFVAVVLNTCVGGGGSWQLRVLVSGVGRITIA